MANYNYGQDTCTCKFNMVANYSDKEDSFNDSDFYEMSLTHDNSSSQDIYSSFFLDDDRVSDKYKTKVF